MPFCSHVVILWRLITNQKRNLQTSSKATVVFANTGNQSISTWRGAKSLFEPCDIRVWKRLHHCLGCRWGHGEGRLWVPPGVYITNYTVFWSENSHAERKLPVGAAEWEHLFFQTCCKNNQQHFSFLLHEKAKRLHTEVAVMAQNLCILALYQMLPFKRCL